jgi:hypothetical protein
LDASIPLNSTDSTNDWLYATVVTGVQLILVSVTSATVAVIVMLAVASFRRARMRDDEE